MIDFEDAPGSGSSSKNPRPATRVDPDFFGGYQAPAPVGDGPPPKWLAALNDRQREATLMTEGPVIVLAGAGSGKTKMLVSRVAYLIEVKRVQPWQILAMTFTNKAAAEMRERVERLLGEGAQEPGTPFGQRLATPEIGTFHAVCVRLLRREMASTPFTKPFVIYDDSDQLSLVKGAMSKLGIDDKAFNPKAIQGAINRAKCDAIEPHELQPDPHNFFDKQAKRVYEAYQKELFANNALDFGEIICMTYRILRDNPEVRAKYQGRWRYLHVDEYQDTNRAQYALLQQLSSREFGGHQNICVVGDEDQSIYKWRGADIRNILDFEQEYPGAGVVKLEQNYRSTKNIITAAGHVIRNNQSRKDKTLWTDNEEGQPLIRAQVADERQEADVVIAEIKRLAQGTAGDSPRSYDEFSIFYRTNAQSRQFEDVFRREKIPYQIVGGLRFYDRKEIKDILSYFKVVLNPSDSVSNKRVINVPGRGIGKTTLDRLEEYRIEKSADSLGYWDVLQQARLDGSITSNAAARKIDAYVKLIERLIVEQPNLLLSELYHLILDETGYVRELRQEGTEEASARVENLEEFDTLLKEFEEDFFAQAGPGVDGALSEADRKARYAELLPTFIEQSALASEVDRTKTEAGDVIVPSVKMMTLHSSKGLEFPVVFMVGMEEGLFPSIKQWEEVDEADVEEERRLCYVGMTRARERLYMLNAVMRRFWGNTTVQEPSRFFDEMPEDLIVFKDFAAQARQAYSSGSSGSYGSYGTAGAVKPVYRSATPTDYGKYGGTGKAPGGGYGGANRVASDEADGGAKRSRSDDDFSQDSPDSYDWEAPAIQNDAERPAARVPVMPPVPRDRAPFVGGDHEWVGRKLNHPEYGRGTIVASEGSGSDQKVTVEFAGKQQRKFIYRYVASYVE